MRRRGRLHHDWSKAGRISLWRRLLRSDEVPTDKVIGMDKRFAAEEVITQPLTVEYDKIIEQRVEEAVISESVAYAKVIPDAVKVLDVTWP